MNGSFFIYEEWQFLLLGLMAIIGLTYQVTHKNFLFLTLFCGFVLFSRSFSHLYVKVVGIPFYITESVLLLTLLSLLIEGLVRGEIKYLKVPLSKQFMVLYLIGLVSLIRGLYSYGDKTFVLRHAALFYYSIFYFLIPMIFNSMKRIEQLMRAFFICTLIVSLPSLFGLHYKAFAQFSYYYISLTVLMSLFYITLVKDNTNKFLWGLIICLQLSVVITDRVRAAWLGMFASGIFVFYLLVKNYLSLRLFKRIAGLTFFGGLLIFLVIALVKPNLVTHLFNEVLSTFLVSANQEDVESQTSIKNAQWRLYVWKDIIEETLQKPFLGWGFGKKFVPSTIKALGWGGSWMEADKGWQDPHNSFLSIFHRTGIVGLLAFLVIMKKFVSRTLKVVKQIQDKKIKTYIFALLVCIIFILGTSFFMVVLEGPFLGSFLWICMGLIVSLENIYRKLPQLQNAKE